MDTSPLHLPKNIPFVFFGTPNIAMHALEALALKGYIPSLVVTQPDKPVGRKHILTPPPVKQWAKERDIEVIQPERLTEEALAPIFKKEWELFIVAAYGKILPEWILNIPRHGVLNIHPSLLPQYRGASPVRTAILENNPESVGVSVIRLVQEMDAGPILAQKKVGFKKSIRISVNVKGECQKPTQINDNLGEWPLKGNELEEILMRKGGALLAECLSKKLYKDNTNFTEQDHTTASFSKKITKKMGEISLDDEPWKNWLKYNALYPWPGIFYFDNEKRVKITEASYKDEKFIPLQVIPEGGKEISFSMFKRVKK